jgi:hypothetical protein
MGNRFASGKNSIALCDRCGFQFKLTELRKLVVKTKINNVLVCSSCWDPDQPQLMLGTFPVDDPQAVRNPRRDTTYVEAGVNAQGFTTGGSRDIQWGYNPVGGSRFFDAPLTPNDLVLTMVVGQVTISVT